MLTLNWIIVRLTAPRTQGHKIWQVIEPSEVRFNLGETPFKAFPIFFFFTVVWWSVIWLLPICSEHCIRSLLGLILLTLYWYQSTLGFIVNILIMLSLMLGVLSGFHNDLIRSDNVQMESIFTSNMSPWFLVSLVVDACYSSGVCFHS